VINVSGIKPPIYKKLKAYLKIYDAVGNVVNWQQVEDFLKANRDVNNSSSLNVDIYWNGLNQRGMMVAPGVYRSVIYLEYEDSRDGSNKRLINKIGIPGNPAGSKHFSYRRRRRSTSGGVFFRSN